MNDKKRDRSKQNEPNAIPSIEGREPPHDLEAEAAVCCAALIDEHQLDEITWLKADHFYSESHRRIYEAAVKMRAEGQVIDIVTLSAELRVNDRLAQVGGNSYLITVINSSPALANVSAHAKIIFDAWRARQTIFACQKHAALGYLEMSSVGEYIGAVEKEITKLSETNEVQRPEAIVTVAGRVFADIAASEQRGRKPGIMTGIAQYDDLTMGLHETDLTIVAARPGVGKSAFAMSVALNVSTSVPEQDLFGETPPLNGVAFFSIEMAREQLIARGMSIRSGVPFQAMRAKALTPGQWSMLVDGCKRLQGLPFMIDDTTDLDLAGLRAKIRRIALAYSRGEYSGQRELTPAKLAVVFVDYLQLMKSNEDNVRSREQEVAALSRGLKRIAKEEKISLVALSAIRRASENTPKAQRPHLNELKECLAGETLIYDAKSGCRMTIAELVKNGSVSVSTVGLTDRFRCSPATLTDVWSTGTKDIVRVRTRTGRILRCTGNHPVRTLDGWVPVASLSRKDVIAVPRSLPEPTEPSNTLNTDELKMLGYLISDGHYGKGHSVSYHGQLGHDKRVPAAVFTCNNERVATFIGALWAGDGSVIPRPSGGWLIKFTSTSIGLLHDCQHLLLRLGICSNIGKAERNTKSTMDIWTMHVSEREQIMRFAKIVPMPGAKGERLREAAMSYETRGENAQIDRLPIALTARVAAKKKKTGLTWEKFPYKMQGKRMGRRTALDLGTFLDDRELLDLATSDVLWDAIDSIEPDGREEVFDLRVPRTANTSVNDIFVHNSGSLEADADNVVLLYRPEHAGEQVDPGDEGKTELELAKQRNGPTGKAFARYKREITSFVSY